MDSFEFSSIEFQNYNYGETTGAYNFTGNRIIVSFCLNEMNKEKSCFYWKKSGH